jgi:hypothetical protein
MPRLPPNRKDSGDFSFQGLIIAGHTPEPLQCGVIVAGRAVVREPRHAIVRYIAS